MFLVEQDTVFGISGGSVHTSFNRLHTAYVYSVLYYIFTLYYTMFTPIIDYSMFVCNVWKFYKNLICKISVIRF